MHRGQLEGKSKNEHSHRKALIEVNLTLEKTIMWTMKTKTVINNAGMLDKWVLASQAVQTSSSNSATCISTPWRHLKKEGREKHMKKCVRRLKSYVANSRLFPTFVLQIYMGLVKLML